MGRGVLSRRFRAAALLVAFWCALNSSSVRFSQLSGRSASATVFVPGDRLKGTVTKFNKHGAILDLNQVKHGFLHISQVREDPGDKIEDELSLGQEVEVTVKGVRRGEIKVTMLNWEGNDSSLLFQGARLNGTVTELNKHGAILDLHRDKPGYLHISQIRGGFVKSVEDELSLGQEVEVTVQRVSRNEIQVTRLYLNRESSSLLMPGDRLNGTVTSLNKMGAILDLNRDKPGYLHISQVSGDHVDDIKDKLSQWQNVEVTVKRVGDDEIEVTMKNLKGKKLSDFSVGDTVKGKITKVWTRRVFLDVGAMQDAVLGVENTSDLSTGQELEVTVRRVDGMGIKVVEAASHERR